jgi:serine/threonine-protein kinase
LSRSGRTADPAELRASGDFVHAGRIYESRHEIDDAIDAYVSGRAWQEAARLLSFQGRFRDAGMTLLRSLPDRPTPVIRISTDIRRDAMNAALCFARGGARKEAVGLLINLGEHQRAAGLLQMAGLRDEAVRAMRGEHIEGSPWPPGILFNPAAEGAEVLDSGPSWSSHAAAAVPEQDAAPWESDRSEVVRRTPPPTPPTPPPADEPDFLSSSSPDPQANMPLEPGPPPRHPSSGRIAKPAPRSPTASPLSSSLEFTPLGLDESNPGRSGPPRSGRRQGPSTRPTSALGGTSQPPADGRSRRSVPGVRGPGRLRRGTPGSLVQQELASYLGTSPEDHSYPIAVNRIIELVWNAELLSARVTRFLDDYLARVTNGPIDSTAFATLYALGRLFEFHDRIDGAKLSYRALLGVAPDYADAQGRLHNIEAGLAEAVGGTWQPVHLLIDGVHKFSPLPEFDDMPLLGEAAGGMVGAPIAGTLDRDALPPDGRSRTQETVDFTDCHAPSERLTRPARRSSSRDDTMDADDYATGSDRRPGTSKPRYPSSRHRTRGSGYRSDDGYSDLDDEGGIVEGTLIANRYEIKGLIGSGGRGPGYSATDLELEEVVAIKVFQQVIQNRAGLDRFRREMKLSRKLVHPNIVRIYEFGTWKGARFITMELLEGDDLEEFMRKRGGPIPPSEALRLMIQACDGLGAAHEAGVIHRDVKPQNLFVIEDGTRLKVMDFGIAKVNDSAATISVTGVRVGTPRYMSPEQIQGDAKVTPASDLYALGGVMYELLTATPVFQEEDLVPLLLSHMTEEPQPPTERNPDIDPKVEEIIMRLLRKSPEARYASCADLKKALLKAFVESQR